MKVRKMRTTLLTLSAILISTGLVLAQGHGGGGHGGPGGPPGGGMGQHDSTGHGGPGDWGGCDSTNHDSSGFGGGHHNGGHGDFPGWGHGDSTGHDSSGFGGHHGGGHDGGGHWGYGDSLSLDSVFVTGIISTSLDTMILPGGHHFPGAPDSGEFIHTSYFLDADGSIDYQLMHINWLARIDSTFILPVDGDYVEINGLRVPSEEDLARILVLDLSITDDAETFGTLATDDPTQLVKSHALQSMSYPNPFNPSTTIEFTLSESGSVSLKIYDIRGVEVAVLAEANFPAGVHKLNFNPQTLSAGTYLYVLEAGGQREVRRIAYLK